MDALPPLLLLFLVPIAGSLVLAVIGARDRAPEANVAFSFVTFLVSAWLTVEIISGGAVVLLDEQFFVDPLNAFLVALTAFVGFTTSLSRARTCVSKGIAGA